jgi:hypothetical protein
MDTNKGQKKRKNDEQNDVMSMKLKKFKIVDMMKCGVISPGDTFSYYSTYPDEKYCTVELTKTGEFKLLSKNDEVISKQKNRILQTRKKAQIEKQFNTTSKTPRENDNKTITISETPEIGSIIKSLPQMKMAFTGVECSSWNITIVHDKSGCKLGNIKKGLMQAIIEYIKLDTSTITKLSNNFQYDSKNELFSFVIDKQVRAEYDQELSQPFICPVMSFIRIGIKYGMVEEVEETPKKSINNNASKKRKLNSKSTPKTSQDTISNEKKINAVSETKTKKPTKNPEELKQTKLDIPSKPTQKKKSTQNESTKQSTQLSSKPKTNKIKTPSQTEIPQKKTTKSKSNNLIKTTTITPTPTTIKTTKTTTNEKPQSKAVVPIIQPTQGEKIDKTTFDIVQEFCPNFIPVINDFSTKTVCLTITIPNIFLQFILNLMDSVAKLLSLSKRDIRKITTLWKPSKASVSTDTQPNVLIIVDQKPDSEDDEENSEDEYNNSLFNSTQLLIGELKNHVKNNNNVFHQDTQQNQEQDNNCDLITTNNQSCLNSINKTEYLNKFKKDVNELFKVSAMSFNGKSELFNDDTTNNNNDNNENNNNNNNNNQSNEWKRSTCNSIQKKIESILQKVEGNKEGSCLINSLIESINRELKSIYYANHFKDPKSMEKLACSISIILDHYSAIFNQQLNEIGESICFMKDSLSKYVNEMDKDLKLTIETCIDMLDLPPDENFKDIVPEVSDIDDKMDEYEEEISSHFGDNETNEQIHSSQKKKMTWKEKQSYIKLQLFRFMDKNKKRLTDFIENGDDKTDVPISLEYQPVHPHLSRTKKQVENTIFFQLKSNVTSKQFHLQKLMNSSNDIKEIVIVEQLRDNINTCNDLRISLSNELKPLYSGLMSKFKELQNSSGSIESLKSFHEEKIKLYKSLVQKEQEKQDLLQEQLKYERSQNQTLIDKLKQSEIDSNNRIAQKNKVIESNNQKYNEYDNRVKQTFNENSLKLKDQEEKISFLSKENEQLHLKLNSADNELKVLSERLADATTKMFNMSKFVNQFAHHQDSSTALNNINPQNQNQNHQYAIPNSNISSLSNNSSSTFVSHQNQSRKSRNSSSSSSTTNPHNEKSELSGKTFSTDHQIINPFTHKIPNINPSELQSSVSSDNTNNNNKNNNNNNNNENNDNNKSHISQILTDYGLSDVRILDEKNFNEEENTHEKIYDNNSFIFHEEISNSPKLDRQQKITPPQLNMQLTREQILHMRTNMNTNMNNNTKKKFNDENNK